MSDELSVVKNLTKVEKEPKKEPKKRANRSVDLGKKLDALVESQKALTEHMSKLTTIIISQKEPEKKVVAFDPYAVDEAPLRPTLTNEYYGEKAPPDNVVTTNEYLGNVSHLNNDRSEAAQRHVGKTLPTYNIP